MNEKINTDSLRGIALFLEGFKEGRGNLSPLGTLSLDELWKTIRLLEKDPKFSLPNNEEVKKMVKIFADQSPDSKTSEWLEVDIRRGMNWMYKRLTGNYFPVTK